MYVHMDMIGCVHVCISMCACLHCLFVCFSRPLPVNSVEYGLIGLATPYIGNVHLGSTPTSRRCIPTTRTRATSRQTPPIACVRCAGGHRLLCWDKIEIRLSIYKMNGPISGLHWTDHPIGPSFKDGGSKINRRPRVSSWLPRERVGDPLSSAQESSSPTHELGPIRSNNQSWKPTIATKTDQPNAHTPKYRKCGGVEGTV